MEGGENVGEGGGGGGVMMMVVLEEVEGVGGCGRL